MKLMLGINPDCSDAVFRFYTQDTQVMAQIIEAFARCSGHDLDVKLNDPADVDGITWDACNHEGECIWEPHLGAFVLRVGNNDLKDEPFDLVKFLGITVEEVEVSPLLDKYARDCCCGNIYFKGYAGRLEPPKLPSEKETEHQ